MKRYFIVNEMGDNDITAVVIDQEEVYQEFLNEVEIEEINESTEDLFNEWLESAYLSENYWELQPTKETVEGMRFIVSEMINELEEVENGI